jgi:hypothetical protein
VLALPGPHWSPNDHDDRYDKCLSGGSKSLARTNGSHFAKRLRELHAGNGKTGSSVGGHQRPSPETLHVDPTEPLCIEGGAVESCADDKHFLIMSKLS